MLEDRSNWGRAGAPQLFFLLDAEEPLAPASRHLLEGVDVVTFRRGDRGAQRLRRRLDLGVPDPGVRITHARVTARQGRWVLEDTGVRNRTLVNGSDIARATLSDGDRICVGRTCWLFRDARAPLPGPADLSADQLAAAPSFVVAAGADRREDLGLRIGAILRKVSERPEKIRFTVAAARALCARAWPADDRDLEAALAGAVARAGEGAIDVDHLAG